MTNINSPVQNVNPPVQNVQSGPVAINPSPLAPVRGGSNGGGTGGGNISYSGGGINFSTAFWNGTISTTTTTATAIPNHHTVIWQLTDDLLRSLNSLDLVRDGDVVKIPTNKGFKLVMPDESCIIIEKNGNYKIDDKDSKVIYKASRIREFNPYINASDMLTGFIRYLASEGIKKSEVLTIPIALFIRWLVIEAAKRDEDPIPEDIVPVKRHLLFKRNVHPRCLVCQRFIEKRIASQGFEFCNPLHADKHFRRLSAG
jgi:hypothetical protein